MRWTFDTVGNSVALLTFRKVADELTITSELNLRRHGFDEPIPRIAQYAEMYPFSYAADDSIDLAPLLSLHYPSERADIERWMADLMPGL